MCKVMLVSGSHVRSFPALRMTESPLAFVLGQIRTSPVLKMEDYVPSIQESLRKAGYPWFAQSELREIHINSEGESWSAQTHATRRWLFANKDRSTSVVLSNSFLGLQTVAYETFDSFCAELLDVADQVMEELPGLLVERIGLRYVDVVRATRLQPDEHLRPRLRGYETGDFEGAFMGSRYEFQTQTDLGLLQARCYRAVGTMPFPEDLLPLDFDLDLSVGDDEHVIVLDFDHYAEPDAGQVIERIKLENGLWRLHNGVEIAFRQTVTEDALVVWGAEPA